MSETSSSAIVSQSVSTSPPPDGAAFVAAATFTGASSARLVLAEVLSGWVSDIFRFQISVLTKRVVNVAY